MIHWCIIKVRLLIITDASVGVGSLEAAPHVQVSNKGGVEAVNTSDLSETLPTAGDGGGVLCSLMVGSLKMGGKKLQIYQRQADLMLYYILKPLWNWRKIPVLLLWHFQRQKIAARHSRGRETLTCAQRFPLLPPHHWAVNGSANIYREIRSGDVHQITFRCTEMQ